MAVLSNRVLPCTLQRSAQIISMLYHHQHAAAVVSPWRRHQHTLTMRCKNDGAMRWFPECSRRYQSAKAAAADAVDGATDSAAAESSRGKGKPAKSKKAENALSSPPVTASSTEVESQQAQKQEVTTTETQPAVSAIEPPTPAGMPTRTFSPKIQNLVSEIAKLTLIEVSQLNELMKKTFNIPDQPMMPVGMMAAMPKAAGAADGDADAEGGEGKKKVEKTAFTVKLTKFDEAKKIALIKEIKNSIEGLNLVQAKKFVESAPQIVKADMDKDAAEKLKAALVAAGATIEIE